jgi:hypothetical protein
VELCNITSVFAAIAIIIIIIVVIIIKQVMEFAVLTFQYAFLNQMQFVTVGICEFLGGCT